MPIEYPSGSEYVASWPENLTIEWKLTGLVKSTDPSHNLSNVIIGTRWTLTGTDGDGSVGTFIGATPFDLSTVDPNNFTPYESLTETQVLEWVKTTVERDGSYVRHISERITEQIEKSKRVVVEVNDSDFPWAPPAPEPTPAEPVGPVEPTQPSTGSLE